MKVFISWSGPQAQQVAESLRDWLPKVLMNKIEPFVSSKDIAKGERGLAVISAELENQKYGVVVLTRENVAAPWVNFEAGALSKSLGDSRVATVRLDVTESDVVGPLSQFQNTALTDKEDVWRLVVDLNRVINDGLPEASIRVLFDNYWGDLETVVNTALMGAVPETTRSEKEILEEVLDVVRGISREQSGLSTFIPVQVGPIGAIARASVELALQEHERLRAQLRHGDASAAYGTTESAPAATSAQVRRKANWAMKLEEARQEEMFDAAMSELDDTKG